MSKSIIGEQVWAELTESPKEIGRTGAPTEWRPYRSDASLEDISLATEVQRIPAEEPDPRLTHKSLNKKLIPKSKQRIPRTRKPKPRFGLPEGFIPRTQQSGRSVLLEDNVYRLPSGQEFIPTQPTGTLGKLRHLYALLTVEQFAGVRRGSVYVRTDGRIFDYSVDHADPARDMFDTGYTIYDLERTGRYADRRLKKRHSNQVKPRKSAQAG